MALAALKRCNGFTHLPRQHSRGHWQAEKGSTGRAARQDRWVARLTGVSDVRRHCVHGHTRRHAPQLLGCAVQLRLRARHERHARTVLQQLAGDCQSDTL